ncbi:MAG: hypothetical protein RLZZ429_688 [Bacteroidota bacterium]|jgi:hypothetical protein
MKSTIIKLSIFLLLITEGLFAQPPGAFYLQGVAKDNQGNPARNRTIHYQISIYQARPLGGPLVYQESHVVQSNNDGVYEVVVGRGIKNTTPPLRDSLSLIDWGNGPYFMNQKIAVAPSIPAPWWIAANNYVDLGTQQILSAVYAMYAGNASVQNVTTNIPAGPPNTFLTTDSLGNVNWTSPQAAQVNVTQVTNVNLSLSITTGQNARIPANTTTIVTIPVPGVKPGDPIFVAPQNDYRDWAVYSAWCSADGVVSVRFANFTSLPVDVLGSQYKVVIIK